MRKIIFLLPLIALELTPPQASAQNRCNDQVSIPNALMISNPLVVNDARSNPGGPWHFSSLIFNLLPAGANRAVYTAFILDWLEQYHAEFVRTVPGAGAEEPEMTRQVSPRPDVASKILNPWLKKSRHLRVQTGEAEDGTLEPSLAPFVLRAIVNRSDLRLLELCSSDAGQGRFVFATLEEPTADPVHSDPEATLIFNVIFEYRLPITQMNAMQWAQRWSSLSGFACSTSEECSPFRARLQEITDLFSKYENLQGSTEAAPKLQIRTNDVMSYPGELREFSLTYSGEIAKMVMAGTHQTPDLSENRTAALGLWVFEHRDKIRSGNYTLPAYLTGFSAPMPRQAQWKFPNIGGLEDEKFEELRFQFSKNTCNGCHNFEFARVRPIDLAYHVSPRGELSRFLTEQELPVRQNKLCQTLAQTQCTDQPVSLQRRAAHARIH